IDEEVRRIINESHDEAKRLLAAHRAQLDALAQALVARETLNEKEILQVTGLPPAPALDSAMLPVPRAAARRAGAGGASRTAAGDGFASGAAAGIPCTSRSSGSAQAEG